MQWESCHTAWEAGSGSSDLAVCCDKSVGFMSQGAPLGYCVILETGFTLLFCIKWTQSGCLVVSPDYESGAFSSAGRSVGACSRFSRSVGFQLPMRGAAPVGRGWLSLTRL